MPTSPSPSAEPRPAVLIVDDEADILESLTSLFEAAVEGLRVYTAASGREALAILADHSVDLILSDYRMPGMDGLEFLRIARQSHPQVPRLMMTAFPELEIALQAINDAGIEYFLTKPLAPGHVIDVVRSVLQANSFDAAGRAVRDQAKPVMPERAGGGGSPGAERAPISSPKAGGIEQDPGSGPPYVFIPRLAR